MKASELVKGLRILADALDKEPEIEVNSYVSVSAAYTGDDISEKDNSLSLAKIWPRPAKKFIGNQGTSYEDYRLVFDNWAFLKIDRSKVCRLVKPATPAVYDCPSILSAEEEAQLGTF